MSAPVARTAFADQPAHTKLSRLLENGRDALDVVRGSARIQDPTDRRR